MMSRHRAVPLLATLVVALVASCAQQGAPTPAPAPATSPAVAPATATEAPPATTLPAAPTVALQAPTAEAQAGEPIYLSIIWHQHQPLYFKDPETGIYQKPWVRLHAAKDYVDMAAMLEDYPDIQATFNLTPSLLRQLLDLAGGAVDLYWVHTEVPAAELSPEQKDFILSRFFDTNSKIIARLPRYQEIADQRDRASDWDAQTWLDLQVLFNLAWSDPDFLAVEPLAGLVSKGRGFAEEDKAIVLSEHSRLIAEVIPLHKRLQDEGRIEVTMTPFFHPILPLLVDTTLARNAVPDIELPPRFSYPRDAVAQLQAGVDFYAETFGRAAVGMWPAEGAVAEEIVGMISRGGIQWMASDEEVLARSLGRTAFGRDSREVVQEPDALYRPYIVQDRPNDPQLYVVFRDKVISDKVGFTYSGTEGLAAAQDFVQRILAIRSQLEESGASGPHLVSVILDGENAWENYPNDGKEFLNNLYRLLEEEQRRGTIQTITPGQFVARFPDQPAIDPLWAGSWVSPDYLTWIGEDEENRAWEYLRKVREEVEKRKKRLDEATLAQVMDAIYTAEGSDWFWWYGADQNSGDDGSFDLQFRLTLQRVYELMGDEVPTFLMVPVIPQAAVAPAAGASAVISPTIDGLVGEGEWDGGGYYTEEGGVQTGPEQLVGQLWYGFDKQSLYLRLEGRRPWSDVGVETRIGFYLTRPGGGSEQPFSRIGSGETLLGFGAHMLVEAVVGAEATTARLYAVDGETNYIPSEVQLPVALSGSTLELALPYAEFGKPDAGDGFRVRVVVSEGEQRDIQAVPEAGPGQLVVPDLGLTTPILTIVDPEKDDHGPGTYVYPSDGVFGSRAYDLIEFAVAEDENNLIFRFTFAGKLNNDWGAPNGMGVHTLDVYVDAAEGDARKLLGGRNAALPEGSGWDFALWAEGWTPGLYGAPTGDAPEPVQIGDSSTLNIISDPGQSKITVRVPKRTLAESLGVEAAALDPATWGYLGLVMSQEGYPSSGVWRIRDVNPSAAQWRFGGAPADSSTHTRIIDVAYPADFAVTQEEALSRFTPQMVDSAVFDALSPEAFAQLPLVVP